MTAMCRMGSSRGLLARDAVGLERLDKPLRLHARRVGAITQPAPGFAQQA
jgi:hypothetical protein